jgi:hypothetical protein
MRNDYDEKNADTITFNGSTVKCSSKFITVSDDCTVTISREGTYILSGELTDGMVVVEVDKSDKVQLVLDGVTITKSGCAAIYIKTADKVFLTLAEGSENSLTSTGEFETIDENNIDATIFSKEDLTINGTGSLSVSSETGHGIVSKDDLKITSGVLNINAAKHGLSANDSIRILDMTATITCEKDAMNCKTDIYICGGNMEITAGDDGMHADSRLWINDGTINILSCYEGLEGETVDIDGGDISLKASDDGINAAGGTDQSGFGGFFKDDTFGGSDVNININGGTIYIDADGDGIDSNGALTVTGGTIYVSGPTSGADGAIDYDSSATISGGTVIAVGASQMAQNFGSNSTQCSILATFSTQNAGSAVKLTDDSGNTIVEWTAEKTCSSIVISSPELEVGKTYTLTVGSYETEITLDSVIYGSEGGFGTMGGGRGGMGGGSFGGFGGKGGNMPGGSTDDQNGDMGDMEMPDGGTGTDESSDFGKGFGGRGGFGGGQMPADGDNQMPDGTGDNGTMPQMPDGAGGAMQNGGSPENGGAAQDGSGDRTGV